VFIDDVQLASEQLDSWRSQIGYVGQDTFLFNDTIRFNLDWAAPGSSEAEMLAAVKDASAADFVGALPAGIDTVIGERGVRLSGWRAAACEPRASGASQACAADSRRSDERARLGKRGANLPRNRRAPRRDDNSHHHHRLSSIRNVDTIHVLDGGKVVASGSWDDLIAGENPRFRELCRAQGLEAIK
jgi:ABC-type multidrug transport system, ATPase and permease components